MVGRPAHFVGSANCSHMWTVILDDELVNKTSGFWMFRRLLAAFPDSPYASRLLRDAASERQVRNYSI